MLIGIDAFGKPPVEPIQHSQPQEATQQQPAAQPLPARAPAQDQPPSAPYKKPACDSPRDQTEADYCIQVRMAESTEEQAKLAWRQLGWSISEAGMLFLSVMFTAIAAFAAVRATKVAIAAEQDADKMIALAAQSAAASRVGADAMTKMADVSEKSLKATLEATNRQLRPYISVTNHLEEPIESDDKLMGFRIGLEWQNTGVSAAIDVSAKIHLRMYSRPSGIPNDMVDRALSWELPPGFQDIRTAIGPRQLVERFCSLPLGYNDLAEMWAGQRRVFVRGIVEYSDNLQGTPRYEVSVCNEVLLIYDPQTIPGDAAKVFRYRNHWNSNYAT